MSLKAAVGRAGGLNGREVSAQAARQALNQIGGEPADLAVIFSSSYFPVEGLVSGISPVLGDTPLIGFSTAHELTDEGTHERSIVVALLHGQGIQAQSYWWPDLVRNPQETSQALVQGFAPWDDTANRTLFLALDALDVDLDPLWASLPAGPYALAGCLAGGALQAGQTYQIGGGQAGSGGLAAAVINGKVRTGLGTGHGWQPVGAYFQVTQADGLWIRTLDGRPASEAYASLFGYRPEDWCSPPLNEMVRLYPLGVETGSEGSLLIRSPLKVEADGSLRMSTAVPKGSTCHLMVGSVEACLEATHQAARQALAALGDAEPALAVVVLDVAWQAILEGHGGRLTQTLKAALGDPIPLAGGYTFGQVARTEPDAALAVLNQHIEILVFGG